ncbi:MAG: TfoX/Sxy family protein [Gammaproteobacteria bacterium]|nr:TfoX/Sxy family protein [Gammaproteobacteria bacterium]
MTKEYLEQLSIIMKQVTARQFNGVDIKCKHFFSGAAVYADGRICVSLTPAGFAIKLPEQLRGVLLKEEGAKKLRYFSKGPIKKEYVVLPNTMLTDMKVLRYWVNMAVEYALIHPTSVKKKRGGDSGDKAK